MDFLSSEIYVYRRLYWTDWGSSPRIETAFLDGTNRDVVIDKDILRPNGLTIDIENQVIFWCDAGLVRIESVNLRNKTRRVIVSGSRVGHPFGITHFKEFVFWTDWSKQAIVRAELQTGKIRYIRDRLSGLMGIEMYDKSRQKGC